MASSTLHRSIRAAGAILIAAAAIPFAVIAPANATVTVDRTPDISRDFTSAENKASAWVGVNGSTQCWKHEASSRGSIDGDSHGSTSSSSKSVWKMGTPPSNKIFTVLVLKSGTTNDIWNDPTSGASYGTKSGKDISHVIVCKGPKPTTPPTTAPPTTTPPTTTPPTTNAPTTTPPTAAECAKGDIEVVSHDTPMYNVTVRIKQSALNKGVTDCWVSLNSYDTDGPTWPTSGVQRFLDHDEVLLTDDAPQGSLTVAAPNCFGQTDLYYGNTRYDGIDGALPVYPNVVTPYDLIKWWNGGEACSTTPPTTEPPTTEPPTTEPPTTEPPTTEPPTTEPPTTEPPTTEPPTTEPPTTEPPTTEPPTTEPPVVDGREVNFLVPECDGDVPWLTYSVSGLGDDATITVRWINPDGDDVVDSGLPTEGSLLWPGAEIDDEGNPTDWPGWTLVDGEWIEGDEYDWTRPEVQVLITVDGEESGTIVVTGLNRQATVGEVFTVGYPPATPECAADPETGIIETSDPGDDTEVLGDKIPGGDVSGGTLPQTGSSSLALQVGLSLVLLAAGAALIALPNRLAPAAERRH